MNFRLGQEFSAKGTVHYLAYLAGYPKGDRLEYHGKFLLTDAYILLLDTAMLIPMGRVLAVTGVEPSDG